MFAATDGTRATSIPPENYFSRLMVSMFINRYILSFCYLAAFGSFLEARAEDGIDYESKVKAALRERCFACHGPLRQEANLRLDTVASMLKGGDSGAAIVAMDPTSSLLIQRITAAETSQRMPPEHEGEKVGDELVQDISKWIAAGANAPAVEQPDPGPEDHWAYQPVTRPTVPVLENQATPLQPLDAFLAKLQRQQEVVPQPLASPEVLLRRAYIDLIGLPPPPAEIEQLPKESADAATKDAWYAAMIDRLLNDPRHGERWARHWMDVWRYSDWWGLGDQLRNSQLHMWHWRDWIVESLNNDTPYDEMVRLMLAGDEYRPGDVSSLRATGFLARNYFLFNRNQWMDDTVEHVSKGLLGITMNCAKCHDHKYDPISQAEYYKMRAIFEPYHVRMDMLEGESDLNRNALPRVFDGLLEQPTYLFIRGQESSPDKSAVLQPGVPAFLNSNTFKVEPVSLPAVAWEPERQPWVIQNAVKQAELQVTSAQAQYDEAIARRDSAKASLELMSKEVKEDVAIESTVLLQEDFAKLDPQRWTTSGGQWELKEGKLLQLRDGQQRSTLRWSAKLPKDFDVRLRFTIRGGSLYRSVGISFDCTTKNPAMPAQADDNEVMVYVSAYAQDPKIQGSYHVNSAYQYPADARVSHPVELNRSYDLHLQVRGDLVNAALDGQPKLAWRIPVGRRDGFLQLTAFDVLAEFEEVTISQLSPSVKLREPGSQVALEPKTAFAQAEKGAEVAQAALDWAKAELASIRARGEALTNQWASEAYGEKSTDTANESIAAVKKGEQNALDAKAIRLEREASLAKAKQLLVEKEYAALVASAEKKAALEMEVTKAREAVTAAEQKLSDQSGSFTKFVGTRWSATRFFNSGADDPVVTAQRTSTGRRRALAEWVVDKQNPLTARVAVNHLWTRHFGEPLVPNVFDFGMKGVTPQQVELLDWLASEFVESGWSMKYMHRLLMQSETYRRSSSASGAEGNLAQDPDNKLWWRRMPLRMEAQVVRDSVLALAGTLDETRGGPPIMPNEQEASKRRSLYFFHSNNERNLFLQMFDEALVKECYRREQNIIPQQALALSNSSLVLDAAPLITKRLSQGAVTEEVFVQRAFAELLGIRATKGEVEACQKALAKWRMLPDEGLGAGTGERDRVMLVWSLLNHNDFVTLR